MWKSSYSSWYCDKYFYCILVRTEQNWQLVTASGYSNWLTMMLWVSMLKAVSSWIMRSVSYSDKNSLMHTHTNVVKSAF